MYYDKWDRRFISLAKEISFWSSDPSTKVGAIITDSKNRVISMGYNGLPRGIDPDEEYYNNREARLLKTIHAEENALLFSSKNLESCTIYTYPFIPCSTCAIKIIQVGISRVVTIDNFPERWESSFNLSKKLFEKAGIKYDFISL